ncbi:hypothetical protein JB92DRAFT_3174315 [Gautieria morchelliformis]|nr:hypothetical protein JB92DRAFT_3174315 [Gautieria morchelliformis]
MASRGMDAQAIWKSVSKSTAKSRRITKNDLKAKPNEEDPFISSVSDSDSISDNANYGPSNQYPEDFGDTNIAVDNDGDVGNADSDSGGNGTYVDSVNGNGDGDSGDSELDERCDAGNGNAFDDSVSEDGNKASSHHSPDEEEEAKRRKKECGFGTEGVKAPKPKGTGGRDFSIREHLGLDTGEEDDKQIYKEILCSVRDWSSQILNTHEPMREQDNRKVLEECLELNHFERVWPIKALIQQFLKNSSELKRVSARQQRNDWPACHVRSLKPSLLPILKVGFCEQRTASRKGSMMGAGKSSEPTGKGSMMGAGKSSEPTGKGSMAGAGKPHANFRSVGNHDQATSSMKRKTPADGGPSIPVEKHYKTLEDVPAPMHAKRLQAASKAGVTNKSARRKTAPKKADPEPRKSKR